MSMLATVCCLASMIPAPADLLETSTSHDRVPETIAAAPQGKRPSDTPRGNGGGVSGGTPEPGILLLLAGGALSYGVLRRRRRRQGDCDSQEI